MSIISGFNKVKNYVKTTEGYKLLSRWTSSDTVDVNGKTLTEVVNELGTASKKDVAASGNASASQVVMGNDTRLSDARKASDVSAWAKASTKPTYTASEVGAYTKTETDTKLNGKANSSHTHGNGDITSLDASKITSGIISIDRLPHGALERLTVVADDTARFKLTSATVQKGDTVKVTATGKMYYVVDETKLSTEAGYEVYAAGTAASVPWSGVTGKPSTYTPSSHTHDDRYYTESEIDSKLSGKANSSHTHTIANITNLQSTLDGKAASNHTHSQYLTSHQDISGKLDNSANGADSLLSKITSSWTAIPTDDTYFIRQDTSGGSTFGRVKFSTLWSYIKGKTDSIYAKVSHKHTKSEITDFPTSMPANGGNSATVNGHTVKSDVPENAVFTDTVYDDTEVQSKLNNKRDKVLSGNITDNKRGFYKIATITDSSNYSLISFGIDISNGTYYDRISVVLRKSPDGFSVEGDIMGRSADSIKVSIESTTTLGLYVIKSMDYTDTFYEIYNLRGEANQVKIKGCSPTKASESIEYLALPYYYNLINKNKNIISELSDRISDNGYGEVAGGKNLLNPTLQTTTQNGVTCTNNGDGTYTLNGTATSQVIFGFKQGGNYSDFINKNLKIVGCPKGGTESTFMIAIYNGSGYVWDFGNGAKFNFSDIKWISIVIRAGQTVSNLVFKPMITTDLNATYNDFESYFPSNKMLAEDVDEINSNLEQLEEVVSYVSHGKNLIGTELNKLYPVYIKANEKIVSSRYDGQVTSIMDKGIIDFYGKNKELITRYSTLLPNTSYRVITVPKDVYYLAWEELPYVDFQIEMGDVATSYEPYNPYGNKQNLIDILAKEKADKSETTVNLLNPTLQTTTQNGITCTNNGDGTYTLNGTATATVFIQLGICSFEKNKNYKLLGWGNTKYARDGIGLYIETEGKNVFDENGEGGFYTPSSDESLRVRIVIANGATISNAIIKPMITTNLYATYDDFVPYTGDTGKLNSDVANIIKLQSTLGGQVDSSIYSSDSINLGRKKGTNTGKNSFAFGNNVEASDNFSHAEGNGTKASNDNSHAEGNGTTASGDNSHAEGGCTTASGSFSHAEGYITTALDFQHAQGHYNNTTTATANSASGTSTGTEFVIGNGTYSSASNAFRVTGEGKIYATNASINTGADYAEYFEWSDGNPNNEDRVGYFVTFDNDNPEKIKLANSSDDYILGIVSGMPSIIGNGDEDWKKRYILDDFGRYIKEEFEYEIEEPTEELDEEGNIIFNTVKKTGTKWKENPDYDNTKEYTPRDQRQEWSAVGMLGVLSVYDDGTCEVNGFCKVSNGGIATKSEDKNDYRVISRLKDNIVRVVFR